MFKSNLKNPAITLIVIAILSTAFIFGCSKKESADNTKDNTKQNQQTETKPVEKPKDNPVSKTEQTTTNGQVKDDSKSNDKTTDKKETTNEKTTIIDLSSDMICETSMPIMKKALMKVNGVKSVKFDEDIKNVKVVYDASLTDVKHLENAIIQTGYDANGKEGDAAAYQKLPGCCKIKDKK